MTGHVRGVVGMRAVRRLAWSMLAACSSGGADTEGEASGTVAMPSTSAGSTSGSSTSGTDVPTTGDDSSSTSSTSSTGSSTESVSGSTGSTTVGVTTGEPCDGLVCDGACVDVMVDAMHCGACDEPCAAEQACVGGSCVCPEGATLCGEACVDVSSDVLHCGGCGVACEVGDPCVQGSCDAVDVVHLLITGQSLSNGYNSAVVSTTQPYANLSFNTGVRAGGANLTGFVPLVETVSGIRGETIASGMANLAGSLWMAEGFEPRVHLASAHGVDGFNYSKIKKGTQAYTNGMLQVTAGSTLAEAMGLSYEVRAMMVIHGESDHLDYPPEGSINYAADLLEWRADYEADVQAITGQATPVRFFYCQMSSWTAYGAAHSTIPEQQRRVARDNPDRFYLIGPKYFLPYSDTVHLTGEGSRWLGEFYAKALRRVFLNGQPWRPLGPSGATVNGSEVVVDFEVPAPPLVLDEVMVGNPGNFGFTFTDGSGTPPTISAVAISGPEQVTVTLSGPPGPQARLGYAAFGMPGKPAGATTGPRGNLRDSDATPSLSGLPLYNWAVHFELALE